MGWALKDTRKPFLRLGGHGGAGVVGGGSAWEPQAMPVSTAQLPGQGLWGKASLAHTTGEA